MVLGAEPEFWGPVCSLSILTTSGYFQGVSDTKFPCYPYVFLSNISQARISYCSGTTKFLLKQKMSKVELGVNFFLNMEDVFPWVKKKKKIINGG